MNLQPCDKYYENSLNLKAKERLGFRYIMIIFDCFIKRNSFKASEEDMKIIPDLFRLTNVALWTDNDF
jgi:hypothetical protein